MNSPLGKYSQLVAAIVAVLIIGAYVVAVLFGVEGAPSLLPLATLALGAVFGAASTANGYKEPLVSMQQQLNAHLAAQPDLAVIATTAATAATAAAAASPASNP